MGIHSFTQRKTVLVATGVALLGAAVFGIAMLTGDDEVELPQELSVESLQAATEDRGQMRERIHEAFQRQDLTEQQRRQLGSNVRQVMGARMNQRLDEYFTADKAQRRVILDRQIDEMRQRIRERQQNEGQNRGDGGGRGMGMGMGMGLGRGGDGNPRGPDGGPHNRRDGQPTREQRKQRSEARDPDSRARRMAYFTALRQRAEERGIEMPSFHGMHPRGRSR